MPAHALASMAKEAGVSMKKAEKYWDEAKAQAAQKFKGKKTERFWRYVMGIVKKRLGKTDSIDLYRELKSLGYPKEEIMDILQSQEE